MSTCRRDLIETSCSDCDREKSAIPGRGKKTFLLLMGKPMKIHVFNEVHARPTMIAVFVALVFRPSSSRKNEKRVKKDKSVIPRLRKSELSQRTLVFPYEIDAPMPGTTFFYTDFPVFSTKQ